MYINQTVHFLKYAFDWYHDIANPPIIQFEY